MGAQENNISNHYPPEQQGEQNLKKGLKARHLTMISIEEQLEQDCSLAVGQRLVQLVQVVRCLLIF